MTIFTDGYGGDVFTAIDGHVRENNAGTGYATATTMIACSNATQRMSMLLKFDLSSIPDTAVVSSATLYLYNTFTSGSTYNYSIHRIKAANDNWMEAASWNIRQSTPDTLRWAGDTGADGGTDAGCSVSGTDYEATAIATFSYTANEASGTEHAISLDADQVEAMLTADYGLVIIMTTASIYGNYGWATSDHATTGYRPKLVVDYTTGITGTLAATLGAVTVSAAGTVESAGISGSLSITLSAITISAAGTVEAGTGIVGELSITLGGVTVSAAGAHGILYTDGYDGDVNSAADVNLHQTAATYNGGAHDAIQFGTYNYALIRFNLAAIPAGATILSAKLVLGLYEGGGSADIFAVLAANAGWIEGTRNLQLALSGEPCWNALAADGAGGITTAWAGGSNGCGVAGTDISSTAIGQLSAASAGVYEVDLDAETVEGWCGVTNPGILIKPTTSNSNHIALSDYATAAYRPKLVVLYINGTGGSLSQTLGPLTLAASGVVAITGAASAILGDVTATVSGQVVISCAASNTLGAVGCTADGNVAIRGAAEIQVAAITLVAAGQVTDAPVVTGMLAATLEPIALAMTGQVAISGIAICVLNEISIEISGAIAVRGSLAISLGVLALTSSVFIGVIATPAARIFTPGARVTAYQPSSASRICIPPFVDREVD